MPNVNHKVFERLFGEKNVELMPHELEQLLEAELAKPEDEMDTEFISEVLHLLEKETPSDADKEADWKVILHKVKKQRRVPTILRRTAIVAASIIAVFFISFTTARAFNWTLLLKYLMPVAQTFGIVSPDYQDGPEQASIYWTEDDEDFQEIEFKSLDEIPGIIGKAIVSSGCIPNRFSFEYGIWSDDGVLQKYYLSFSQGEEWMSLEALEFALDTDSVIGMEYERQTSLTNSIEVDGIQATMYYNSENEGYSASWLMNNIHYDLFGMITEDDVIHMIHALYVYQ